MNQPTYPQRNAGVSIRIIAFLLFCSVIFSSFDGFGQATSLFITTQPVIGTGQGSLMAVQPVVEVRNAANALVNTSTAQVQIVIASGTGGTLGGTTRINAVNGVATFTNLTFSGVANQPYTFQVISTPRIVYEDFAYPAGTLTGRSGGSGWSGAWFNANPAFTDLAINTTGFSYTNFTTNGGRSTYTSSTGGDAGRSLAAVSNAVYSEVWVAFLGNYDLQGGGFNNVRFYLPGGLSGGVGGNGGISNWSILNSSLGAASSTSTPLNGALHLSLVKIDYTAGTTSLWIDPVVNTFDGTQTPSATAAFAPVFDRIELYNRSSGIGTDEITVASTYKAALHLEQNLTPDLSAVVLPVSWTYFTSGCDGANTLLKWGTADEQNNSHFVVERSMDAVEWMAIGNVHANSVGEQQYQFRDSAFSTRTYYRLRQVDNDGTFNLSKTVMVQCENNMDPSLQVFPNPAGDRIQFRGAVVGSQYVLTDVRGRVVRSGIVRSMPATVSLSGLPEGSYFLKISGSQFQSSVHVLKAGR